MSLFFSYLEFAKQYKPGCNKAYTKYNSALKKKRFNQAMQSQ